MIIRWRLPSYICTRPGRALLLVGAFVFIVLLFSLSRSDNSSAALEREISRLSVYYVRALARERGLQNVPSSVDLHKTMPVLLRSLALRLNNIEGAVPSNWSASGRDRRAALPKSSELQEQMVKEELERFNKFCDFNVVREALLRSPGKCQLPSDYAVTHPECQGKQDWIAKFRDSHRCYGDHGVDATPCSAIFYLSEVESFCPRSTDFKPSMTDVKPVITDLSLILIHAPQAIQERVTRFWPEWSNAATTMSQTLQQRMALYIGKPDALSYLETLMWADLAAGLHALGHKIVWIHSKQRLEALLSKMPPMQPDVPCPGRPTTFLHLLYTDAEGLRTMETIMGRTQTQLACIVRVLSPQGEIPIRELPPPGMVWRQFLTAYPVMDDHVFLGFAVSTQSISPGRKNAAVLGTTYDDFARAGPYLQAVSKRFPIHTAIPDVNVAERVARALSPYVTITNTVEPLETLFDAAAVLVGLGRPLNDPVIIEAMGKGVKFVNPLLPQPVSLSNLSDQWTQDTQHSYLQKFNMDTMVVNPLLPDSVEQRIAKIKEGAALLPYEFMHSGYLERLAKFLKHHTFCIPVDQWADPNWPPLKSIEFFLGVQGDSCEMTCLKRDRRCDPSFFPAINMRGELEERGIACGSIFFRSNPLYPAVDPTNKACHFQAESRRYSCFHRPVSSTLQRICPCRSVKLTQNALCDDC